MTREAVRIRCVGYFDQELTNVNKIQDVMAEIEQGSIRRPEFELVCPRVGKHLQICVAALFREGGHVVLEGWFVWHAVRGSPDNVVYCIKKQERGEVCYKSLLRCGAPETIDSLAILTRTDAARLLASLANGEPTMDFEERSFRSVLRTAQE